MVRLADKISELIGDAFGRVIGHTLILIFVKPVTLLYGSVMGLMRPMGLLRERHETRQLHEEAKTALASSLHGDLNPNDLLIAMVCEAMEHAGKPGPGSALWLALADVIADLMIDEGWWGVPDIDWSQELSIEEAVRLRNYLRNQTRLFVDSDRLMSVWSKTTVGLATSLADHLPPRPGDADGEEDDRVHNLRAPLINLADEPAEMIEGLLRIFFNDELVRERLFEDLRERIEANALVASGIDPQERYRTTKEIVLPTRMRRKTPTELTEIYLGGTPFERFFLREFPFSIPAPVRFEHCHIVGGTGHGKTQLLQLLIHHDLMEVREGRASVVVIDSQGDLIRKLSRLSYFSPKAERSLADRLLLIDPNDIEYPVALNMFDLNLERLNGYSAVESEKILNGSIELYEYIFGALLGAELTQKQGVIFRYLARLMLVIPNATVQTLLELMEDGTRFRPYMAQLEGTTRRFFETQFFERSFAATKQQILKRLWGVLSNTTFERMFSNPTNKVDLFEAMNSGKVILINTAKDLLKQEGCEIFGRFFIAMIVQAALQRAAIPEEQRTATFVYVDEAHDYFDENVSHILNQARKYKVALHVAHQNLDQLSHSLAANIMASTSIKLAGGVSAKDATTFAKEMQCEPAFLQGMKKRRNTSEFACWIKNTTPQPLRLAVPLGFLESLPVLSNKEYEALVAENRRRYCVSKEELLSWSSRKPPLTERIPPSGTPAVPRNVPLSESAARPEHAQSLSMPSSTPPLGRNAKTPASKQKQTPRLGEVPALPGRGGRKHKYLQQLIKQVAEERGFRATIEEELASGGRVDVSLQKGDVTVACEISVTSTTDQELGNIRKCFAADYREVVVLTPEERQLRALRKAVVSAFGEDERMRLHLLLPEGFVALLDGFTVETEATEQTIRGYRVKVRHQTLETSEATGRRKAIAQVIARSLTALRDERSK